MASPRIFRPFNSINDAKHLEWVRSVIAHSLKILQANPPADTFTGRKTQEPFPNEHEFSDRHYPR